MGHTHEHYSKEELLSFLQNESDTQDTLTFLEHLSVCDSCSILYADLLSQTSMVTAPHYMKSNILEQVQRQNEVTEMTMHSQKSMQKQLFFYSLRVTAAMCGALFFLFSGTLSTHNTITTKTNSNIATETMNQMYDRFNQFTNILTFTEETNHDQETK